MPVSVKDVMRLLGSISENKKMRVTFKYSVGGTLLTGVGAFIGFQLGGPPGLAVGSAVTGLLGSWMWRGKCQSLPQILMELPPAEQQKLYDQFMAIVRNLDWRDAVELAAVVTGRKDLQEKVVDMLWEYVTAELGAKVRHGFLRGPPKMSVTVEDVMRPLGAKSEKEKIRLSRLQLLIGTQLLVAVARIPGPPGLIVGSVFRGFLGTRMIMGRRQLIPWT